MKLLQARLHSIEQLADGIQGFDFRPLDQEQWPGVAAGSHINAHLPNGLMRSYSLVNAPGESCRYVIAVNREASGKGGSTYLHDQIRVGQVLSISQPHNSFPLKETSAHSVLIAGGIGVTALWSMVQRLSEIGAPWTLHYSARERECAAFVDPIVALASNTGGRVCLNFDGGASEKRLDLSAIVEAAPPDAHMYCCGPVPMLEAFESACARRDPALVHREYFVAPARAKQASDTAERSFMVTLVRSGKTIQVDSETSILDAIVQVGVDVSYSCASGVCGACETRVLCGEIDHRDYVLSDAAREGGETMMICCSRAMSAELSLDL